MKVENLKMERKTKEVSLKSKLRSVFNCVYFIQILKKGNRNKFKNNMYRNEKNNRIERETQMLKLERINNPELQKLKQTLIINK